MNKRTLLERTMGFMLLMGIAVSAYPFIKSLSVNAKSENSSWASCDLSELREGETMRCGLGMVYRRTAKDKASINKYHHLLADPNSKNSTQPIPAKNKWRSENPDYFVYRNFAPGRGCGLTFVSSERYPWAPPEKAALDELPYFTEPCEGRTWDMSGRLYKREGYPPEQNLYIPKVQWKSATRVLVRLD